MTSYTNTSGGTLIQVSDPSYEQIILNANIELSWPSDFQDTNIVAALMDVSPTGGSFTLKMPDATNTSVGTVFSINSKNSFGFTLLDNTGGTISVISGNSFNTFYLTENDTAAGVWTLVPYSGSSSVTGISFNTDATSGNIVTSGSPITTSGTISLTLGEDLAGLCNLGTDVGIAVRNNSSGTWSTTLLSGTGNQIAISNASGVSGSPTISLEPNISGINSISLFSGNLNLGVTPNTLASNNSNGSVRIVSQGTGSISFITDSGAQVVSNSDFLVSNAKTLYLKDADVHTFGLSAAALSETYALNVPTSAPVGGQVLGAVSSTALGWLNVTTYGGSSTTGTLPYFTDTIGTLGDSNIFVTGSPSADSIIVPGTFRAANINIGTISSNTIGAANAGGSIVIQSDAPGNVSLTSTVSVNCTNSPFIMNGANPIRFNNSGNTFFSGLKAGALVSSTTWTLPLSDGTTGQFISTDGAANLSFASAVTGVTAGSNLTGGTITTTGTIALSTTPSGLTSIGVGNLTLSGNTISSATSTALALVSIGDMTFTPSANASFISNIIVRSGNYLQFNNTGNTFSVALKAGAVSSNTTWTLPLTDGSNGQFMSTNGTGTLSFSSAVTSVASGSNLTGGTITTTGTIALSSTPSGLTSVGVGSLTLASTNVSSSGALVLRTNGSTTALTLSAAQKATFAAGIETAPAVSGTPTLSLGVAYQNTLGYDVILSLYLDITVNSPGSISCGVGPTNSPTTQTILSGSTVLGYFPITVYLPSSYYVIVNTSSITASIVGQQVTAV